MRALLWCFLVFSLAVSPAIAGTNGSDDSAKAASSASTNSTDTNSSTSTTTSTATQPAATSTPAATSARPTVSSTETELNELRDQMDSQSRQIQEQSDLLKAEQDKMNRLEQQLKAAKSDGESLTSSPAADPASGTSSAASDTANVPKANAAASGSSAQISDVTSPQASPLQLKIGSAYITPVGFMDFTGVFRSTDGGSGIGTNFGGIPYGGASAYTTNLSEFRLSMQNSRIGFRVDANVKGSRVMGYMEADFLGNNAGNVAVTSNSNTLRSRLYWVDVRHGAWEMLGGQSWSLATPNRVGVSPLPGDVFFSFDMDVNYQLGMVWGRIPEFRVAYHFPHDKAAFALALDSPEQYGGGVNGEGSVVYPSALNSTLSNGELNNGGSTLGVPNLAPDVIAKFVIDPTSRLHGEIGGIARFFQLYDPVTAAHYGATGGAVFGNLDVGIGGGLRLLTHNFWGDGGGRYIFAQAPDMIVRANGTPSLIHSGSSVDGFEFVHKNSTAFAYWGMVYVDRDFTTDTNNSLIGYGYKGSSNGDNRFSQEPTIGFIQNFWKDARYGALSLISQLSYVTRDPWYTAAGQPSSAATTMVFLDLRYTLPGSAPTLGAPGKE